MLAWKMDVKPKMMMMMNPAKQLERHKDKTVYFPGTNHLTKMICSWEVDCFIFMPSAARSQGKCLIKPYGLIRPLWPN